MLKVMMKVVMKVKLKVNDGCGEDDGGQCGDQCCAEGSDKMQQLILSCLGGFALGLTDIGDCRVAFATETTSVR